MPETRATLDSEWSLLLTACSAIPQHRKADRIRSLLQEPIRWEFLFDLADRHGTLPLLHQALAEVGDAVPPKEMRVLIQSFQTNLHKAMLLARELIRIVDHLAGRGIEVIPYKGPSLAEAVYGDIALRQSGDIDLLIHSQDLPRVRDAVSELSYTPHLHFSEAEERAYLKSGYEFAFDGAAGPNLLEVQWAIQPRFYAVDFDMNGLFQRAMTTTITGQPMKTVALEDLFLVLSLHAAKHVWARLAWLCDISQVMRMPVLNWNSITSHARELGVLRILSVTMLLANRMLGAEIPAAAKEILREDYAAATIAKEIQKRILNEDTCNPESLAYFRLMMRLRERPADRLRFLWRLIFTPGPSEWSAVRLPRQLFPLYRLVRLSRLAARMMRA